MRNWLDFEHDEDHDFRFVPRKYAQWCCETVEEDIRAEMADDDGDTIRTGTQIAEALREMIAAETTKGVMFSPELHPDYDPKKSGFNVGESS